jgi:magnesium transporter
MIRKYRIENNKLLENGDHNPPVWVFVNPDEAEKKLLVNDLRLDEHTLNSALDPDELARLEFEVNHAALIFKHPKNYSEKDTFLFKVASMGMFLFADKLVIVTSEELPLFVGKCFNVVESPQDAFLKVIYRSIFHFLEHLKVINMISDEIERKISVSMENKYLLNLFSLEKSLVYYLNAINSNSFVIDKIKHAAVRLNFSEKGMEFVDDLAIENNQCYRQAEIYSNILASLMDARVSIVSNNLNILMKTLNFITITIMVPTLVVSAFSMNVGIPFQKNAYAFWIILSLAILSVLGVLLWWRRASRLISKEMRGD